MSRIIRHSNYTEITNGLFMEIADKEFTFAEQDGVLRRIQDVAIQPITRLTRQDIEEAVHSVFEERPMFFGITGEEYSDFSRALLEGSRRLSAQSRPTRFYNMSEEEIIQYFDRISQEEEN